jgi:hypothetical protein
MTNKPISGFVSRFLIALAMSGCGVTESSSLKYVEQLTLQFSPGSTIVSQEQADQLTAFVKRARAKCSKLELGLSIGISAAIDPRLPTQRGKEEADARAQNVKAALLEIGAPAPSILAWSSTLSELEQRRSSGARIDPSADAVVLELVCSLN